MNPRQEILPNFNDTFRFLSLPTHPVLRRGLLPFTPPIYPYLSINWQSLSKLPPPPPPPPPTHPMLRFQPVAAPPPPHSSTYHHSTPTCRPHLRSVPIHLVEPTSFHPSHPSHPLNHADDLVSVQDQPAHHDNSGKCSLVMLCQRVDPALHPSSALPADSHGLSPTTVRQANLPRQPAFAQPPQVDQIRNRTPYATDHHVDTPTDSRLYKVSNKSFTIRRLTNRSFKDTSHSSINPVSPVGQRLTSDISWRTSS